MAQRHWVGGTAAWDGVIGSKWALTAGGAGGQAVPTSSDDVFFDASSTGTCTVSSGNTGCKSLNMTGNAGTFAGSSALTIAGNDGATNSLILGGTVTYTGTITFTDTSGTVNKITSNGKSLGGGGGFTFNGSGGKWQLQDACGPTGASTTISLQSGTLDLNGLALNCTTFSSFSGTRTLIGGVGSSIGNAGSLGFTCNGAGLTLTSTSSTAINMGILGSLNMLAGASWGAISCSPSGSNTTVQILGGSFTCASLTFTPTSAAVNPFFKITAGNTITVTGAATFTGGNDTLARVNIVSSSNSRVTISAGSTSISSAVFQGIAASGAAAWTGTQVGDGSNNTGITFTTGVAKFWMAVSGGLWSATSSWSLSSGGATGANVPLPQDNVTIDANSITSGARTITCDMAFACLALNTTGVLNAPILTATAASFVFNTLATGCCVIGTMTIGSSITTLTGFWNCFGNFVGNASLTSATTASLEMCGVAGATQQLTMGSTATNMTVYLESPGGTVQLQDALTLQAAKTLNVLLGVWDVNSQAVSVGLMVFSTIAGVQSIINPGTTWTLTGVGGVFNAQSANISTANWPTNIVVNSASASNIQFQHSTNAASAMPATTTIKRTAGTGTFSPQGFLGSIDMTGWTGTTLNSFASLSGNFIGSSTSTSATTFQLTMNGTSGTQQLTMNSTATAMILTINGVGGTTQLQDNYQSSSASGITLTNGTLDANGKNVTVPAFASSNSNVRTLSMGSGTWTISGTASCWNLATSTNLTLNPSTSTLKFSDISVTTKTMNLGSTALTYNILEFLGPSAGAFQVSGNTTNTITVNQLKIDNPVCTLSFQSNSLWGIGSLAVNGTAGNLNVLNSITAATAAKWAGSKGLPLVADFLSVKDNTLTKVQGLAGSHGTIVGNASGWQALDPSTFVIPKSIPAYIGR